MKNTSPKITIVTVTYNAANVLEETIQSIINQTYDNIEYIIIDGGSTDTTLDIIKKYEGHIDYWISEPDRGIYDAMNKAIDVANGEWINFMNAGDIFASLDVVEKIFLRSNISDYDLVYGEHIWKNDKETFHVSTRPLKQMWQKISFCHQSLFTKTHLMKEKKFDLSYKVVCDYENYFSRYMEGKKFFAIPFPIAVFQAGGFSDQNFWLRTKERWSVVRKHKKGRLWNMYYIRIILEYYLKKIKRV